MRTHPRRPVRQRVHETERGDGHEWSEDEGQDQANGIRNRKEGRTEISQYACGPADAAGKGPASGMVGACGVVHMRGTGQAWNGY